MSTSATEALRRALEAHTAQALQRVVSIANVLARKHKSSPAAVRAFLQVAEQVKIFSLTYAPADKNHPFADEALGALRGLLNQTEENPVEDEVGKLNSLVGRLLERLDRQDVEMARLKAEMAARPATVDDYLIERIKRQEEEIAKLREAVGARERVYIAPDVPAPPQPPFPAIPVPPAPVRHDPPPPAIPIPPAPVQKAPEPARPDLATLLARSKPTYPPIPAAFMPNVLAARERPRVRKGPSKAERVAEHERKFIEYVRANPDTSLTGALEHFNLPPKGGARVRHAALLKEHGIVLRTQLPHVPKITDSSRGEWLARRAQETRLFEEAVLKRAREFPKESLTDLLRALGKKRDGTARTKAIAVLKANKIKLPDGRVIGGHRKANVADKIEAYFRENPTHTPADAAAKLGMWDRMHYIYTTISKRKLTTGTSKARVVHQLAEAPPAAPSHPEALKVVDPERVLEEWDRDPTAPITQVAANVGADVATVLSVLREAHARGDARVAATFGSSSPAPSPEQQLTDAEQKVVDVLADAPKKVSVSLLAEATGMALGNVKFALQQLRRMKHPLVDKVL